MLLVMLELKVVSVKKKLVHTTGKRMPVPYIVSAASGYCKELTANKNGSGQMAILCKCQSQMTTDSS